MNSTTLQICIKYAIVSHRREQYEVLADTAERKYLAARELSTTEGLTHQSAMTRINRLIGRVNSGLDPTKDNRGGARKGAGRKKVIKS